MSLYLHGSYVYGRGRLRNPGCGRQVRSVQVRVVDIAFPRLATCSLASLAAALTAANLTSAAGTRVCLTDPTDWPGGQLTASAVPAVDYGPENGTPPSPNAPAVFNEMMNALGDFNMGNCWVSARCFETQLLLAAWIFPKIASLPNLRVYYNTVVTNTTRDPASGRIASMTAVQRACIGQGCTGWDELTSRQWTDWYTPTDSPAFTKTVYTFTSFHSVIEATEFGDVLGTSGVSFAQGVEAPLENSTATIDWCGQGTTVPLFMSYGLVPAPSPDPVPPGSGEGLPFSQQNFTWARIWTYRRSHAAPGSTLDTVLPGEISNQNWGAGNDYDNGYLFLPVAAVKGLPWTGGVNVTAMEGAYQRAYGWYHWYKGVANASVAPYLTLNHTQAGTGTGLAKMPYLRDTRRSGQGLNGFRLFYEALAKSTTSGFPLDPIIPNADNRTGYPFADRIGIGIYFYADIHQMSNGSCPYPSYIGVKHPVKPYFIPFRALTNADSPNLLVAGKAMAATFQANAALRLHPEEWVSGTAAAAAATLMLKNNWTTSDMYANVGVLQQLLLSYGQPLNWTLPWPPHSARAAL